MRRIFLIAILCLITTSAFAQDSLNITRVWQSDLWYLSAELELHGNLLYVAELHSLKIADVTDRSYPEIIMTTEQLESLVNGLTVQGNYVCLFGEALDFYDVSEPRVRQHIGHYVLDREARDAVYFDDHTLLVTTNLAITIYDVSDPNDLTEIFPLFSLNGTPDDMALYGNYLYAESSSNIKVVDLTDISEPIRLSTISNSLNTQSGLEVFDGKLYVVGDDRLRIFGLDDPANPTLLGSLELGDGGDRIAKSGDTIVVGGYESSIQSYISVVDPANPTLLGDSHVLYNDYDVECAGREVYSGSNGGIYLTNIEDPTSPRPEGKFTSALSSDWHYLIGNVLVTDDFGVYDVSDPILPLKTASLPVRYGSLQCAVGDAGYVTFAADSAEHLPIYLVSNPANPRLIYNVPIQIDESYRDIALDFPIMYVCEKSNADSVFIYDLSVSDIPVTAFEYPLQSSSNAVDIELSDEYLFLHRADVCYLYRRQEPNIPELLDSLVLPTQYYSSALFSEDLIFLCLASSGIAVIDISNPLDMTVVSEFRVFAPTANYCDLEWNFLAVASDRHGFSVLDVSDLQSPNLVAYYSAYGMTGRVSIRDQYVYVSEKTKFSIYDISEALPVRDDTRVEIPTQVTLSAYPNPFNPSTTIAFDLNSRAQVSLDVYDVTGRFVRTLINEQLNAGSYTQNFDAQGLPSGAYFARLVTPQVSQTARITLIR